MDISLFEGFNGVPQKKHRLRLKRRTTKLSKSLNIFLGLFSRLTNFETILARATSAPGAKRQSLGQRLKIIA
jgi:hypothetical protein